MTEKIVCENNVLHIMKEEIMQRERWANLIKYSCPKCQIIQAQIWVES